MVLLYEQNWSGVLEASEHLLRVSAAGQRSGIEQQLGSVYLAVGNALIATGRFGAAERTLKKAVTETAYPQKGWITYCMLRLAQVYDMTGRRAEAVEEYSAVLARPNFWDSRKYAGRGRKKAAGFDEVMRQIDE